MKVGRGVKRTKDALSPLSFHIVPNHEFYMEQPQAGEKNGLKDNFGWTNMRKEDQYLNRTERVS